MGVNSRDGSHICKGREGVEMAACMSMVQQARHHVHSRDMLWFVCEFSVGWR